MAEKTYTVSTPNPKFNGIRAGVLFTDGKGQATEQQANHLVGNFGYSCAALDGSKPEPKVDKRPSDPEQVIQDIINTIPELGPEDFTGKGLPNVGALEDRLEYGISGAERDTAFAKYQEAQGPDQEPPVADQGTGEQDK